MSLKDTLKGMLDCGGLEGIAELAAGRRRVLGSLVSLTYDANPVIGWRAVEAMGLAAGRVAATDPGTVREHLRRLYWLITEESGGICWRAPEAMAEVVMNTSGKYHDYVPIVVHMILEFAEEDLEHFRPACLWAIGRLASVAGEYIPDVLAAVTAGLAVPDSQARGMAVWCLGQLGRRDLVEAKTELLYDEGPVDFYEDGRLVPTTVARMARRVLDLG